MVLFFGRYGTPYLTYLIYFLVIFFIFKDKSLCPHLKLGNCEVDVDRLLQNSILSTGVDGIDNTMQFKIESEKQLKQIKFPLRVSFLTFYILIIFTSLKILGPFKLKFLIFQPNIKQPTS